MTTSSTSDHSSLDWLSLVTEPTIEPDQIIVDAHHHLWDRDEQVYLLPQMLGDIANGHRVVSTVYVQGRSMYREISDPSMAPVGETEFARGVAAMCASGRYGENRVCDGIVSHADLTLGGATERVLRAHIEAGGDRFKGIRHIATWDPDTSLMNPNISPPPHLYRNKSFLDGFEVLDHLGLSFDAWVFHPQLPDVVALAHRYPNTKIVLNHIGGILNAGHYAGRRDEIRRQWLVSMRKLANCPNVYVKLGGLGMSIAGFDYTSRSEPPSSETLAADFAPYILTAIDAFGAHRCMFESNFPVDKRSFSYVVLWNAYKRLSETLNGVERDRLFYGTAAEVYRLGLSHVAELNRIS